MLFVYSRRLQRRAIFMVGGLAVGLVAVGLAVASDAAQDAFRKVVAQWSYAPLALTPLGFGLAVFIALRFFPNTQGSGIPQAIAARNLTSADARNSLVGFRVALGKIILTLFGLLIGASTGREGPTVQVGASVMFLIGETHPAPSTRAYSSRSGGWCGRRIQHAVSRHRVCHRGDEPQF